MPFLPLDWLLPATCCHCRRPAAPGEPLCAACACELETLVLGPEPRYERVRPITGPALLAWSAYAYAGPARSLVHAFKYRGGAALATRLSQLIADRAPARLWQAVALVPVPAHPRHASGRGYNQSALLATRLGDLLDLPVCDLLERRSGQAPQAGATRADRLALPQEAFGLAIPVTSDRLNSAQFPTNVLLVDDVRTTGVTLEVCASLLSGLFHGEIRAVTFASARRMLSGNIRGRSFGTDQPGRPRSAGA